MEGTDATIRRAGEVAWGRSEKRGRIGGSVFAKVGLTVVKIAKPDHDMRFDVPVAGVPTIASMTAAGATCLCVTAGKTLMFDRDEMIALANQNKIALVAV